jgi:hypothetical protein
MRLYVCIVITHALVHKHTLKTTVSEDDMLADTQPSCPDVQPGIWEVQPDSRDEQPDSRDEITGDREQQMASMRMCNVIMSTCAQQPTYPSLAAAHHTDTQTSSVFFVPPRLPRPMPPRLQTPVRTQAILPPHLQTVIRSQPLVTLPLQTPARSSPIMPPRIYTPPRVPTPVPPRLPTPELSRQPSLEPSRPHSRMQTPRTLNAHIRGLLGFAPRCEDELSDFRHPVYNPSFWATTFGEDADAQGIIHHI